MKIKSQNKTLIIASSLFCAAFFANAPAFAESFAPIPGATIVTDGNTYTVDVNNDSTFMDYSQIVTSGQTFIINGHGHTLHRTGTNLMSSVFNVSEGGTLIINDLTLDGSAPGWTADVNSPSYYYNSDNTSAYAKYPVNVPSTDRVSDSLITNNGTTTLSSVVVRNTITTRGAGAINNTGTLTITNSTFEHNYAQNDKGGVINQTAGTATIKKSTFKNNNAGSSDDLQEAGVIKATGGTVKLTSSTFSGNSAETNGGVYVGEANLEATSNTFENNKCGDDGSVFYLKGTTAQSTAKFKSNKFKNNTSLTYGVEKGDGEGVINTNGKGYKTISFEGDSFTNNKASTFTTIGLENEGSLSNVSLKNVTMTGNKASYKTAINLNIRKINTVTITGLTYGNNTGEIYFLNIPSLTVSDSTFSGNTASDVLSIFRSTNVNLSNISFHDNKTDEADIYVLGSTHVTANNLTAENETVGRTVFSFAGTDAETFNGKDISITNSKIGNGLGIGAIDSATAENITISNNTINRYTGALSLVDNGEGTIKNLTVKDNVSEDGHGVYIGQEINNEPGRKLNFINAQITGNKSDSGAGLVIDNGVRRYVAVSFDNDSVIAGNEAKNAADDIIIVSVDPADGVESVTLPVSHEFYYDSMDARYRDGARNKLSSNVIKTNKTIFIKAIAPTPAPAPDEDGSKSDDKPDDKAITPEKVPSNPKTADGVAVLYVALAGTLAGLGILASRVIRRR